MTYDINQSGITPAVCREDGKPGPGCAPASDQIPWEWKSNGSPGRSAGISD